MKRFEITLESGKVHYVDAIAGCVQEHTGQFLICNDELCDGNVVAVVPASAFVIVCDIKPLPTIDEIRNMQQEFKGKISK